MSLLMTYMHILFDFLHYIHTRCEVVEIVITTIAIVWFLCDYFHGSLDKTGNAKVLHKKNPDNQIRYVYITHHIISY